MAQLQAHVGDTPAIEWSDRQDDAGPDAPFIANDDVGRVRKGDYG